MAWKNLRQLIERHFNTEELRTLCFDLEIDYESLGGEGKQGKIRELINYAKRADRLDELHQYLKSERADVSWPGFTDSKNQEKKAEYNREQDENPVRVAVWNALHSTLWTKKTFLNSHKTKPPLIEKFSVRLWAEFINKPIDSRPKEADLILQEIRDFFFTYPDEKWRDYLEYILSYWNDLRHYAPPPINQAVNLALERTGSNLKYIPQHLRPRIFLYGEIVETDLPSISDSVMEIPEKTRTKIYQDAWEKCPDFSTRKTFIHEKLEAWRNQQNQS